jgi:flagellar motor protein MotB
MNAIRANRPGRGEFNMSWITTASKCALAAGAILLSAGCTSKKDVAIAAKDDTIRRQEVAMRDAEAQRAAEAEKARQAAELNAALARQNEEIALKTNALLKVNAEQTAANNQRMVAEIEALKGIVNNNKTVVVTNGQQDNNVYHDPKTGSIHIQVAGSVLFDSGRAELKTSCSDMLMRIAHQLKTQYPNHAIRIEGHTDSTPVVHSRDRYPDNMALSQARAASVYDFLAKRGGISSSHMYTAGYGDRQPLVSPERTAADRAKNRRVEIVILPNNLKVQKERLAKGDAPARPYQASMQTGQK